MPRYYCDYCDTYLTHDSPSVRKQHNSGYKHKANIRTYYQNFEEQQTQILIEQKIKQHHGQAAAYGQIGAAYNQHLAAYQGIRPRLPIIPPPMFPLPPGAVHPHMAQGIRPPFLPISVPATPGYGTAPMGASATMQPLPAPMFPQQMNGVPAPTTASLDNTAALGTGGYSYTQASQTNL